MEKTSQKIRIISNSEEQFIHPSELLLPLNSFVNLINLLENMESQFQDYQKAMRTKNQSVDFQRFIETSLSATRHHINTARENDCVLIEAMSKSSPYWVDLLITASPYVIETLNFLIDSNHNNLRNHLASLFGRILLFTDENENRLMAEKTIRTFQFITRLVNITIERSN